ncbi:MAG TPA: AAA family ATPase [Burkholderiales bacterium]|nr:AAA family ATPase [Burkholderiales bacterium]
MANVVVIGGPNGAGKSTTAPALLRQVFNLTEFINADTIAGTLSASSPERAAIKAGRIMLQQVKGFARAGKDFAFETTLASRSFAPWLVQLRKQAYLVHLVYLWLPSPELAVKRVAERVKLGGHGIPEEVIRRRYERSLHNFFRLYRPIADSWLIVDNSSLQPNKAIAWRNLGGPVQITDLGIWDELRRKYEANPKG